MRVFLLNNALKREKRLPQPTLYDRLSATRPLSDAWVDMAPSILITTPILLPVVTKFGVDPVHFGMIMLMNLGIGLCHPPVGSIIFVGCAVGKVSMEEVVRRIWPFYLVMFLVLMLVTYWPDLSLWLPRALGL